MQGQLRGPVAYAEVVVEEAEAVVGDQVDQEVATHSTAIVELLSLLVLMEPTIKVMEIVALMAAQLMDAVVLKKNARCHLRITS